MPHEYPPPPNRHHYPPLLAQQLCRKRQREPLPEDDQPFQRRHTLQPHLSGAPDGDEDIAMLEPEAPTDVVMSDIEADEDNCVFAHIPGQAPGFVRLGGSIPSKVPPLPAVPVPVLINEEDVNGLDEAILPQNCRFHHQRSQSSFTYVNTNRGHAKYIILSALLLFSLPFSILLGINLLDTFPIEGYTAGTKNLHSVMLIQAQPASFPRRPDFITLVTIQTRLTAEQLLTSASAMVEVTSLAAELLFHGTQGGTSSSCDATKALLGDLYRVRHHLSRLDMSVAGTLERIIIANSAALAASQKTPGLSVIAIFSRLVNATSTEILALHSEIRSGLEGARVLANTCETTRPLFSTSCLHAACCTGDSLDLEILRQTFLRLDFFAHQLVVQFEEVDATLTLLQGKVGRYTYRSTNVVHMRVNDGFTSQDTFGLEYGIQKLHEHQRRTLPFLSHLDNSLFGP